MRGFYVERPHYKWDICVYCSASIALRYLLQWYRM